MPKILFAASEAHPFIKTGGLADVAGALPIALQNLGCDIRIVLPAYGDVLRQYKSMKTVAEFYLPGTAGIIRIRATQLKRSKVKVLLVDYPAAFARKGNPYIDEHGEPWPDNAERFALFCKVIQLIALDQAKLDWKPDLIHCNDWHSALVPALLKQIPSAPPSLFTIHNLAYQGLFPQSTFNTLGLPSTLWAPHALEFHGQLSFIKGGLVFADRINTVSVQYAKEIQTPALGYGLEGLLQHRRHALSGIVNGIDDSAWNPQTDKLISQNYTSTTLSKKKINKLALQKLYKLPVDKNVLLLGFIGRLVEQKGIDLIIELLKSIRHLPIQFCLLGTGDKNYQQTLSHIAKQNPEQVSFNIGYSEKLAHQIEAGIDIFLMPSRFEPCGLNQLYSLRYGTVPIVHNVGGLADTVIDTTPETIKNNTATGFVFNQPTVIAIRQSINRALKIYSEPKTWKKLVQNGMKAEFTWDKSAKNYLHLYQEILKAHNTKQYSIEQNYEPNIRKEI